MGLIGYDPDLLATLRVRLTEAIADLAGVELGDPAAAGAVATAATVRVDLESGWLPIVERILASEAMIAPIQQLGVDDVLQFLREDGLGRLVFDLVDVAREGDLGDRDGNWSTRDVATAADPATATALVRQAVAGGLVLAPGEAEALTALVTAVARRLGGTDEAWESIDDEVGWYEDVAGAVWDRTSTYGQFLWSSGMRMLRDPGQTVVDLASGTVLIEQLAGAEAILVDDGELYADGPCGDEFACIVGAQPLPGAAATTFGHTVVFADDGPPSARTVRHEGQHVDDIETFGGALFYGSYVADFARNAAFEVDDVLGGEPLDDARQDAYEQIVWERRAEDAEDDPD